MLQYAPKDEENIEDESESTDDEAEPVVTVDEVEIEQVKDDKSFSARVERIAIQAEHVYNTQGNRKDTLFFKIVLAGNVRVVSHVLDKLQEKEKTDVVNWLLMKGKKQKATQMSKRDTMMLHAMQVVMYLIFAFVSVILSPVFYMIHSFTTEMFSKSKHRLAANISLPLAFAAFSKDEDMMKFFLTKGVNIKTSDLDRNTVFHYIADLSSESAERALEIFDCLIKFINDRDVVKLLIGKRRNSAGLTALEYTSKYGSPQLLTKMLSYPGLMQHTAFEAGKTDISFGQTETEEDKNDKPVEAITKLEYVDVTMYEQGDFTTLSTLLNLLSDRELTEMSEEDLGLFNRMAFVGKWISLKTKQMSLGVLGFHVGDIIVTAFLLILLMNGLGSDPFKATERNFQLQVMLEEIKAAGQNSSYIFKEEALEYIFTNVRNEMQRQFLAKKFHDQEQELFDKATAKYPEVDKFYNSSFEEFQARLNITPPEVIDRLFDTAKTMPGLRNERNLFATWQYLHEIIVAYSNQLFAFNPQLTHVIIGIDNREFVVGELKEFFDNFTMTIDGIYIQPSAAFDFWEFQSIFCVSKMYFDEDNVKDPAEYDPPMIPPTSNVYTTSCGYQALMIMANKQCENLAPEDVYEIISGYGFQQGAFDINDAEQVFQIIVALGWLYIFLDVVERLAFTYTCVANHRSAREMVLSVLSKKVPGSYTRKQINMITYFAFIGRFIVLDNALYMSQAYSWTQEFVKEYANFFLVIGLVFRFVMHIHALRLLPGIGHFVITTFIMGTNLIHFSAVYGAVVFIFSIIFHILIEDPECPVKKHDGFESISDSMFSIFKLTFGHGEFDAYYTTTPVMLTYTLYTIIVGLLLMNLIIAIMSTTAENIMTDPWKETTWRVEWLDEALSVEFTKCLVLRPFQRWLATGYWSHKKAGFEVIEIDKEKKDYRIFIEVFYCRALEKDT